MYQPRNNHGVTDRRTALNHVSPHSTISAYKRAVAGTRLCILLVMFSERERKCWMHFARPLAPLWLEMAPFSAPFVTLSATFWFPMARFWLHFGRFGSHFDFVYVLLMQKADPAHSG